MLCVRPTCLASCESERKENNCRAEKLIRVSIKKRKHTCKKKRLNRPNDLNFLFLAVQTESGFGRQLVLVFVSRDINNQLHLPRARDYVANPILKIRTIKALSVFYYIVLRQPIKYHTPICFSWRQNYSLLVDRRDGAGNELLTDWQLAAGR